jgi:hypothetical protein
MSEQEITPVLKFVTMTQPSDLERMQKMPPADSEMMERLLDPRSSALYSTDDKLIGIDSPETRFLAEWKRLDSDTLIPERGVRVWAQALYRRFAYFAHWFPHISPNRVEDYAVCWRQWRQYYCEGLRALTQLFGEETYNSIRFKRAEEFPQFKGFPKGMFQPGEAACAYSDMEQGFVLALMHFGAASAEKFLIKKVVDQYFADPDFMGRYNKELGRGPRDMLSALRQFAHDWDILLVPLRYFTPVAAADFVSDRYGYTTDMSRFWAVFLKGGNKKQGWGLKLTGAKPPIVRGWSKHVIKLNSVAAESHGYNAAKLRKSY